MYANIALFTGAEKPEEKAQAAAATTTLRGVFNDPMSPQSLIRNARSVVIDGAVVKNSFPPEEE